MKPFLSTAGSIVTAVAAVFVNSASAPGQTARTFISGTGAWSATSSWTEGFIPEAQFDESAQINNAASVAQVGTSVPTVAALTVGPGRVEVASGGTLGTAPGAALGIGAATINANGRIAVGSGGTFNPRSLTLNGTLQVTGPSATVNVAGGGLAINGGSSLLTEINSTTFKPVSVDGLARIRGGALDVAFSGFTPTPANTFNVIDADVIDGNFTTINVTGGPALQPYQVYAVRNQTGGVNGMVAKLQLENRLMLSINRTTGIASIVNMAPGAINLDGYSIDSGIGSIGSANFNSFDDQNLDSASWSEIGTQTSNSISELRAVGTTSLATANSRAIGAIYAPNFTALGVETEDFIFTYTNTGGESIAGPVVYQGDKQYNNLVVNIDPATGAAVLVNESPFTFSFDGYSVTSASGALSTTGWNSLQDQAAGGGNWFEINANANKIGELKRSGSTSVAQGASFNLGTIFNTAGAKDLELDFIVTGEASARQGVVSFQTLALPGDFDGNGVVNGLDFTAPVTGFEARFGATLRGGDFLVWQRNFGATAPASVAATAVPEPTAIALALVGGVVVWRRRRPMR